MLWRLWQISVMLKQGLVFRKPYHWPDDQGPCNCRQTQRAPWLPIFLVAKVFIPPQCLWFWSQFTGNLDISTAVVHTFAAQWRLGHFVAAPCWIFGHFVHCSLLLCTSCSLLDVIHLAHLYTFLLWILFTSWTYLHRAMARAGNIAAHRGVNLMPRPQMLPS